MFNTVKGLNHQVTKGCLNKAFTFKYFENNNFNKRIYNIAFIVDTFFLNPNCAWFNQINVFFKVIGQL